MKALFIYLVDFAIVAVAFFAFDAFYSRGPWALVAAKSMLLLAGVAVTWVNVEIRERYEREEPEP